MSSWRGRRFRELLAGLPADGHAFDGADGWDTDEKSVTVDDGDAALDLSAMQADDALLDVVGGADPNARDADADAELKALLLNWRRDVDGESIGELVDTDRAVRVVSEAARGTRRAPRLLVPVASAAAVLAIVFAGMGLAARAAQPGDALWNLTEVLYSDHARSVVAAAEVRTELDHASDALQKGQLHDASKALALAQSTLPSVANEDGQASLRAQRETLMAQLQASSSSSPRPHHHPGSGDPDARDGWSNPHTSGTGSPQSGTPNSTTNSPPSTTAPPTSSQTQSGASTGTTGSGPGTSGTSAGNSTTMRPHVQGAGPSGGSGASATGASSSGGTSS